MSQSFDRLVDSIIDALRTHILPGLSDDFARGQLFSTIYALNGVRLAADWKIGPLAEQVRVQDAAFAYVRDHMDPRGAPELPTTPRIASDLVDAAAVEALRDAGDRTLGRLLDWASSTEAQGTTIDVVVLQTALRHFIRDQLKIELPLTPASMLQEIAMGSPGKAETKPDTSAN